MSKRQVLQGLQHALPYLRRQIAVRCTLRAVPEFSFYYDDTPERAARVDALLRAIAEARAADVQGDPNTPPTAPTAPPAA